MNKKNALNLLVLLILPLASFGVTIFQIYRQEKGFFVLTYDHPAKQMTTADYKEILQSNLIKGHFVAQEDNLGIVGVRFSTYFRINDDLLRFRIRESGASEWYYENNYKVDQFQPEQIFPFGFPKIASSKGKVYEFEIASLKGKTGNAVGVSPKQPTFVSKYEYDKQRLTAVSLVKFINSKARSLREEEFAEFVYNELKNFPSLIANNFFTKKLITTVSNEEHRNLFLTNLSPLLIYLLLHQRVKKYYQSTALYSLLILLPIAISVVNYETNQDGIYLISIILWVNFIVTYRFTSLVSFISSLVFLAMAMFSYYFLDVKVANKLAVWSFLAFSVSVFQEFLRYYFGNISCARNKNCGLE